MKKIMLFIAGIVLAFGLRAYFRATTFPTLQEPIIVVSRENGSGTRSAFVDIVGLVDAQGDDNITVEADVLNGTGGVMQTVAGNRYAIGYISYGSLNNTVKPLAIDGAMMTAETVKSGQYQLARPFNLAWQPNNISPIADDFLTYIFSKEGQEIVEQMGYISVGKRPNANESYRDVQGQPLEKYVPLQLTGQINIVGSTSLTPVVEKLAEQYMSMNPNVKINITSNGSTAGLAAVANGSAHLGMSSRELKDNELAILKSAAIALDGIVIVVNPQQAVDNVSLEMLRAIYEGSVQDWKDVHVN